jgi:molybdopterin/thiamine biosynthesis adenylyltransferase/rhodanese-related sulfurtransferase
MKAKDERLMKLRRTIPQIEPAEALSRQKQGAVIIDVRESDEISQGSPKGALRIQRGFLELNVEEKIPNLDQEIHLICAAGLRSLFAADDLQRMGYLHVASVEGGFDSWKDEGLPFEIPPTLDAKARERYARHLVMPQVGVAGQIKLLESKVLCIGAGGIGSPVALYLAAAGVGTLGIIDHDVVDASNLQRQILHKESSIGRRKVDSARETLEAFNSSINVVTYNERLNSENVENILRDFDVVIDGSDNLPTRYLVNDACVRLGIPNVHGAVFRFEGQVTVFWPGKAGSSGPCYRCLFPDYSRQDAPSCAQAGVLGVLPGVIGLLQAVEGLKIILGIGRPLIGRMVFFDALDASFHELKLRQNPKCRCCGKEAIFGGYQDYQLACATAANA